MGRGVRTALVMAVWLTGSAACGRDPSDLRRALEPSDASAPPRPQPPWQPGMGAMPERNDALSPLQAESWLVDVPVDGFRAAKISVPLGATERRPVMVALHGAGDRPEWACGGWRGATDAFPFIVCPSGEPGGLPQGFVWGSDREVEREVKAAVIATRRRFGAYVAAGCTLLAGFSQGAIRMAPMLARGGEWCPQAVLCEGAYDAVASAFAHQFVRGGGRRILFGCSQPYCAKAFGEREAALRRAGIEVRTVYSGDRTHNLNAEMVTTLRQAWPWLVRDDERWSAYREPRPKDREPRGAE